jgi:ribonucleoside-diphosphate reductase alpha chain
LNIPGLDEAEKKQINRPVPELPISEDTDVVELTAANGNGHQSKTAKTVSKISESVAHFQKDAPTCPNCGHLAVRNGACYKCLNCGESLGCS